MVHQAQLLNMREEDGKMDLVLNQKSEILSLNFSAKVKVLDLDDLRKYSYPSIVELN